MIFILSAPIQTGKTTSVIKWSEGAEVHGILTPVVNGKRVFMDAATKEQFPMEAGDDDHERLYIGRFAFSKKGFEKAIQIIHDAIDKKGWLVIDEIGPLELKGEGFHDVLKETLMRRKPARMTRSDGENMILVVREGLAEEIKRYFGIHATVIDDILKL